ncbi:MAG: hypothetical protein J6Y54_06845 [Lentisphaeria bacterium]|nr:hypothetical protein [Lentisphaeria bacterium]
MNGNVKFDRRVNIRTRVSDRRIFWLAFAVALAAHLLFGAAFNYRHMAKAGGEEGSAVTMLTLSDFPAKEREGGRNWLNYNDPRDFVRDSYGDTVTGDALREVPKELTARVGTDIPIRTVEVKKFRKVPGRQLSAPATLPLPARARTAPVAAAGSVRDGEGRVLPLGGLELPSRTPHTRGRTVLRVFKPGGAPVLLLERSCGDDRLDGFAAHKLLFLARGESAPEFIVVEWPEVRK